jgi:hypothetical protein
MHRYKNPTSVDVNVLTSPIPELGDVTYNGGLAGFNATVGMGPGLINSNAVKDATGDSGFIGGGPAIIH